MSADLCPGGGFRWHDATCPTCGMSDPDPSPDLNGIPRHFPQHTVDKATGEVWVQVVPPKPPEPDPWAVALRGAYCGPDLDVSRTLGAVWHRVAAEARRLADAEPAIRAAHWREMADHLDGCGYPSSPTEVRHQADLVERGEA